MRPPLLLTGGPAAGKSTKALRLVEPSPRVAVIDVDDLRHLVVAGHADDVGADHLLDVGSLTLSDQVDPVAQLWTAGP